MKMGWQLVTENSPRVEDLPVTVIQSKDRERAVWVSYVEDLTEEIKRDQEVCKFFEHGENLSSCEWYPRLA